MKAAAKRAPELSAGKSNEVFAALRAILAEHVPPLRVLVDKPTDFQIVSAQHTYRGRPLWIAGVRQGKSYTSFHLMPVYAFPELVAHISPELKRRKQGKACFNFTSVDPALFAELKRLAHTVIPKFDSASLVAHFEKKSNKI